MNKEFSNKINWFNEKNNYLNTVLKEIDLEEFLFSLFDRNSYVGFQEKGNYDELKSNGIIKFKEDNIFKHNLIFNDLKLKENILDFSEVFLSPCGYLGKKPTLKNLQEVYAIVIDLDGIQKLSQLKDIFHHAKIKFTPMPNLVVNSGNGVHLYYIFEKPIKAYKKDIQLLLRKFKFMLISRVWNDYTSSIKNKQLLSLVQHYRIPESYTKFGTRVTVFANTNQEYYTIETLSDLFIEQIEKVRDKTTRQELNLLSMEEFDILVNKKTKKRLKLDKAKELYPKWYQERIIEKKEKGRWTVKKDLYNWWIKKILDSSSVGHRYFCILVLAIYAQKCGVDIETLRKDAMSLVDFLESKTNSNDNHFTEDDVEAAIKNAKEYYYKITRDKISKMTAIQILPNKRNGLKQDEHLEIARAIQKIKNKQQNKNWRDNNGRKSKEKIVMEYKKNNPNAKKIDCHKATKLSRVTIDKYWNLSF